jgi:hypothetical protein
VATNDLKETAMPKQAKKRPALRAGLVIQEMPTSDDSARRFSKQPDADERHATGKIAGEFVAGGILFRPSAGRPAALDDAAWFKAHPTRSHRVRLAAGTEPLPGEGFTLVRQHAPGLRTRVTFASDVAGDAALLLNADDDFLRATFDLLAARGGTSPDDVRREVEMRYLIEGRS